MRLRKQAEGIAKHNMFPFQITNERAAIMQATAIYFDTST